MTVDPCSDTGFDSRTEIHDITFIGGIRVRNIMYIPIEWRRYRVDGLFLLPIVTVYFRFLFTRFPRSVQLLGIIIMSRNRVSRVGDEIHLSSPGLSSVHSEGRKH